jgi:hypothetical protein
LLYHDSVFSRIHSPELFIDFASMYLDGMPQKRIVEKLGIGQSRGSVFKHIIQELCAEMNLRINMQLGGHHTHPGHTSHPTPT